MKKEIEFSGECLPDTEALKRMLFEDKNDPTSIGYERKLTRPKINWWLLAAGVLAPVSAAVAVAFFMPAFKIKTLYCVLSALAVFFVLCIFLARFYVITAIKIYQRFAPDSVREKCRFEPSCSQYMILAIEKYGLLRGVKKGIGRLRRCNIHGGGFDMP